MSKRVSDNRVLIPWQGIEDVNLIDYENKNTENLVDDKKDGFEEESLLNRDPRYSEGLEAQPVVAIIELEIPKRVSKPIYVN